VYFAQSAESTAAPADGSGPLVWGLRSPLLHSVWVESFWDNLGARSTTTVTRAATAWVPVVGCLLFFGSLGLMFAGRRWANTLKVA
jgi:hypothetical protein